MPDPTKLQKAYQLLKDQDVVVPEKYEDFESAFAAEPAKRRGMYDYFKSKDIAVPEDFAVFETGMLEGVKKKVGGEASGSGAAPDPFNTVSQTQSNRIEGGEELPAGTPMTAPADVNLPASSAAEQQAQPLGMSVLNANGQTDNPEELARLAEQSTGELGSISPTYPQLTEQSAATLAQTANPQSPEALQADADTDGVFVTGLKGLLNSLDPRRLSGNLVDYAGDLADWLTYSYVRPGKPTDQLAKELLAKADAGALKINKKANASILDEPTNALAWSKLLGSGAGSILQVGTAAALGGPGAGVATGAALGISSTKESARQAGISDQEAAITATVLAPIQGILEELGMGVITKNPAVMKLVQTTIIKKALAYGEGKLAKNALVRAASEVMPEVLKEYGKRGIGGAAGEFVTETGQAFFEGEGQVLADMVRSEDAPGRYGTTQRDVGRNMLESGAAAIALGGGGGVLSAAGQAQSQNEATTPLSEPLPSEATAEAPPVAPAPVEQPVAAQPAATAVPTVRLKDNTVLLADFDENGTALRAYSESGQEFSLDDPAVRAKVEEAGAVSLQEQQPTVQANEVPSAEQAPAPELAPELSGQDPTGNVPAQDMGIPAPEPPLAVSQADAQAQADASPLEPNAVVADEQTLPAEEPAPAQEAPAQPAKVLSPEQERVNGVIDAVDNYKQLSTRDKKSKKGSSARAELAKLAKAAGLDLEVGNDFSVKLTRGGKRVTRTAAVTATTPVDNFVPARNRTPEVRDAALTLAGRVVGGSGDFVALGVTINGKRLNPRDAKAAAQDILDGRNTTRANELLNRLEAAQKEGFVEVSTGTGLATNKQRIPFEDYVGTADVAAIRSKESVPLTNDELDTLIAEDQGVQDAIAEYGQEDGSIDLPRLLADAQGKGVPYLQFMFGVNEETATKFLDVLNERASQIPEASTIPGGETPGSAQPASTDSGSRVEASQEEVAPAKLSLREQNEQAKAEFNDALAEFRAARKKKSGVLQSSVLGIPAFSAEESAAIQKMVRALIKRGAISTKRVIAGMRELGFDQEDGTDDQLRPLVQQQLKDAGVFRAKQKATPTPSLGEGGGRQATNGERKTVVNQLNNPTISDKRKARLESEVLNYTPKPLSETEAQADKAIVGRSLAEAYDIALDKEEALPADVRLLVRDKVANELDRLGVEADLAGDEELAQQYINQALTIDTEKALANTEYGRAINANRAIARYSPRQAVYQARKEVARQQQTVKAQNKSKGRAVAKKVREVQSEVVEATLKSKAVQEAKAKVVPAAAAPESATYGSKNKIFTKERLAEAKAAFRKMGLSSIVPPELILGAGYHIEAGTRKFADVATKLLRDFGAKARPYLRDAYEQASQQYVKNGGDPTGLQSTSDIDAALQTQQAEMLANRIVSQIKPKKKGVVDPVQQLLDTLIAKVRETLPAPTATEKLSAKQQKRAARQQAIAHALRNQREYADVWQESKQLVIDQITDPKSKLTPAQQADMLKKLDDFFTETIGQPYATRQATAEVSDGLKDMGATLDNLVRQHLDHQNDTGKTLAQKLVAEAGLDPATAKEYAAVLEKEFQRQLQAKREGILNRMYSLRVRVGLGKKGKTALDRMVELLNLSPVSDSRVVGLIAEQTQLPDLTVQDVANLRRMAADIEQAKGEQAKAEAVFKLLRAQKVIKGVTGWEQVKSFAYANMLSGLGTQAKNISATGINTALDTFFATGWTAYLAVQHAVRTKDASALSLVAEPFKRLFSRKGTDRAILQVTQGVRPPGYAGKFEEASDIEAIAELPATTRLQKARKAYADVMKYVPRLLSANDLVFSGSAEDMWAYNLALGEALRQGKNKPTSEIIAAVNEQLFNTQMRLEDARATAIAELGQPTTAAESARVRIRVREIMESTRPANLVTEARQLAAETTFNGPLEGFLGHFITNLGILTEAEVGYGIQPLKSQIPFTRILANVVNQFLNYTPVGLLRVAKGGIGWNNNGFSRRYTPMTKSVVFAKSMSSMLLMAALWKLSDDDDDKDWLTGAGPSNYNENRQWQERGNKPYTIGGFAYKESPYYYPIAAVASLREAERYEQADFTKDTYWVDRSERMMLSVVQSSLNSLPLAPIQDFLKAFNDQSQGRNPKERVGRWMKRSGGALAGTLFPGSGLIRSVSRTVGELTGTAKREVVSPWDMLAQDIPGLMQRLPKKYDVLGNEVVVGSPIPGISTIQEQDEETKTINAFLNKHSLFLADVNRNQDDMLVLRLKNGALDAATWNRMNTMTDAQRKDFLRERIGGEEPMTEVEWSEFYPKRGRYIKEELMKNMKFLELSADKNPRLLHSAIERITSYATKRAKFEVFGKK